jgi:hypothetical protein
MASGVGANTQLDEGYVVVEGVGGANREIAWRREIYPQKPNIERAGSIPAGE